MRADVAVITRAALAVAALSFCSSWTSWSWSWSWSWSRSWSWLRWCCCNNISIAAGVVPYEEFVLEFLAELIRPRKNGDEGHDEETGEHDVEEDDRKGWCCGCDCDCDPLPFKFDRATPLLRICSARRDASALFRSWFIAGRYGSNSGWRIAVLNYLSYWVLANSVTSTKITMNAFCDFHDCAKGERRSQQIEPPIIGNSLAFLDGCLSRTSSTHNFKLSELCVKKADSKILE